MWIAPVLLVASALGASSQAPPGGQQPTFRGGTALVQVDAIVNGADGRPVTDLTAADFDVLDDGRRVAIDRVRFLGATEYNGDPTLAPIRTHDDEEREASRDDVRVYAILLDDYHVERFGELRLIEPLLAFVNELPPTDLVAVYYPLDSVTDVHFARDREPVRKAIRAFIGRRGDYTPRRPVENEHLRRPGDVERIRRQITTSALEGLATHLGGLKEGRKTVVLVSEGFVEPTDELQDILQAANRANVAIYPVDPRGLTTGDRGATRAQVMTMVPGREVLRTLASETGGRAIVGRNDIGRALDQVVHDASAYYLIAYESPHADDGKFHRLTVRVKRPRAAVFARPGYWAYKREQVSVDTTSAESVSPGVQQALNRLAESLRPNPYEPAPSRRARSAPQTPAPATPEPLLAPVTVAVARGRTVGEPEFRLEFHRTDTLMFRAPTSGATAVSAHLLDRFGRRLTELPVAAVDGRTELRLALGSLGPGDFVMEFSARSDSATAREYVAFRVVR